MASKMRRAFNKRKRERGFYAQFNGKNNMVDRDIHHNKPLSKGGGNENENLVALVIWLHRSYHKRLNEGVCEIVYFSGKVPSLERQCDDFADGMIEYEIKRLKDVIAKDRGY